jgi:ATP-dependent helicase/nuclease subunit A
MNRVIPDDVLRLQIQASDPAASAWVSANAGSGKTYVLAQRVIRLLLEGTPAAKILCLTFTKSAAAHMANQVFDTLARWVALDDAALDLAVGRLEGRPPSAARRGRARRLFAEALEVPGGLKVQTIHAFCTRLLHLFPFEANVAARFSVLEEAAERELIERQRLNVVLAAASAPETALGRALSTALAVAPDRTFAAVINEAIAQRDDLTRWLKEAGSVSGAIADLSTWLGVEPDEDMAAVDRAITESAILPRAQWPRIAAILAGGSKHDQARAAALARAAESGGAESQQAYVSVFLTDQNTPRSKLVTRAISDSDPGLAERLCRERDRIAARVRQRFAIEARERTAAVLTIASAVIERYRLAKEARGLIDYHDLIDKTLSLLTNVEAAWVHYKLDLGIDHVLIDEAQDTSPKQWEIIKRLTAEFTAGAGARGLTSRSLFAVGDEKQSIFSFQGAAPEAFAELRAYFERQHRDAALAFRACRFEFSFRSGANVLSAVDATFAHPGLFASLTTDPEGLRHQSLPGTGPGLVEIWPLILPEPRELGEAWDAPFDALCEPSPPVRLAARIAATVKTAIANGRRPGEVLVLVRQRGPLFEAILRALKNARLKVAGADRLLLTAHLAVMDLLALADALLLRGDDLALATVLKGPFFGFDDDALFGLAWRRRGTLWAALKARAGEAPRYAAAATTLDRLAVLARHETPFAFYARLLGPEGGREQILARLGPEAADALDEFLNRALAYEATQTASLQGFVDFMRLAAPEVKRDMDLGRDEIRVMTVHGAKGLEAPLVILADTTGRPAGPRDPRLMPLAGEADGPPAFVWAGAKDCDVEAVAAARARTREAAEAEYRRLLYVAMTRAAEHLIVCGAQGHNGRPAGCWYDLVCTALISEAVEEAGPDGPIWRWRPQRPLPAGPAVPAPAPAAAAAEEVALPDWLARDPSAAAAPRVLRPSSLGGRAEPAAAAARRGMFAHRLLQALPGLAASSRARAARDYLARHGADLGAGECEELIAKVLAVLDHPDFAALFAPGSRPEVPIVGRLPREAGAPVMVAGQVDRLFASETAILLADYKTDRPAPRDLSAIPDSYVAQLALYRAVLGRLFPGRAVRAALVWVEGPALVELPPARLEAALAAALA